MRAALVLAVIVMSPGCKKTEAPPAPAKEPPPPGVLVNPGKALKFDAAPVGPVLEARDVQIERHETKATLSTKIPAGWKQSGASSFRPDVEFPGAADPGISFGFGGYSCSGECKHADFVRERDALIAREKENRERPNRGTGNPELDEVRLEVTELEAGELAPDGKFIVLRVKKPAGLEGPYPEVMTATCSRARPGDPFYTFVSVQVPLAEEKGALWPLLLDACGTTQVKSVP